jgi:diketogulonate reductase-like aldo/keto reductase
MPDCEKEAIAVVGYTPFGTRRFPPEGNRGKALAEIAARHGATPRQVALAFLTRRPSLFAIPKASSSSHTKENAGAGSLVLTAAEVEALDKAFARGPKRAGIPMI